MTADEGTTPARERGWLGPLAALFVLVMVSTLAAPAVVVPVGDVLLLLAPVTAACAVARWRVGARLPLAFLWTAFAVWALWRTPAPPGLHTDLLRGWAVLLALAFGVAASAGVGETFLPKALLALVSAAAVGMLALLLVPGGFTGAAELVRGEIGRRATVATREWQTLTGTPEWAELVQKSEGWAKYGENAEAQLALLPGIALKYLPALLALQSLAVLALGWAVYHRVGRVRLGPPLADLKDLRFHEALVWGVVAGLALLALPSSGIWRAAGANLLLFFGVLHALRGMGVVIWFLSPGRAMKVVLFVITLRWPQVLLVCAVVGLGDTWFDWRRASRLRSQRSE